MFFLWLYFPSCSLCNCCFLLLKVFRKSILFLVVFFSGYEKVERSKLDGTDRKTVLRSYDHPFAITVLDRFLYWTDWGTRSVFR